MSFEKDLTTAAEISRKLSGSSANTIALAIEEKKVAIATRPYENNQTLMDKIKRFGKLIVTLPRAGLHVEGLLAENHLRKLETERLQSQVEKLSEEITGLRAALSRQPQSESATTNKKSAYQPLGRLWDNYYRAFEDRFRGSEAAISAKQAKYVTQIKSHFIGDALVVDLGCGRGEWLKLVKGAGYRVLGIDSNEAMLRDAKSTGLDVICKDALSWLAEQPPESVDMITAFHVVEHLTPNELLQMLAEAARVVKKTGLILIETPNPENLLVGACNFWTDITHVKPIPPQTLGFMLDFLGFTQLDCIRSSLPFDGADPQNPLQAPQDYAIISKKR